MLKFISKRIGISLLILFFASVLMYVLTINSGDPLQDLRESNDRNRDNLIAQRAAQMRLNDPWYVRYFAWLKGVSKCLYWQCDFGQDRSGQSVNNLLSNAASTTIRLVFLATVLGIVVGIFFGVMAAIRQYSGFDYAATTLAFIFYSLPSFVFAVLLKEYGAIRFNNWLVNPTFSLFISAVTGALFALFMQALVAGSLRKRLITAGISFAAVVLFMQFASVTSWFSNPKTAFWVEAFTGVAAAFLFASLLTRLSNRRALYCVLASAGVMMVIIFAFSPLLPRATWPMILLMTALGIAAAVLIGWFYGGFARRAVIWASVWTVVSMALATIIDFMARNWVAYSKMVGSRPISTVGSGTPNFRGTEDFWLSLLDNSTHLILPTISLTLMSVASYTRYTRSSMLEVLGQDYVRTARAKGMPEHTVMTRHAFRNALLPITTIVVFDFAGLIGGAVITEAVFGWKGMGNLFQVGLSQVDPNPVMAFFLVTGSIAILMNMLADITYAYIDPRIRR